MVRRNIREEKKANDQLVKVIQSRIGLHEWQMTDRDLRASLGGEKPWSHAKLHDRLKNPDRFTRGELKLICSVLGIPPEEIRPYII